jgi:hypothetical protein
VVDIDLQVVAGALQGNMVPLGDGVNQNDVQFLSAFPYVAPPKPGANPDAGLARSSRPSTTGTGPRRPRRSPPPAVAAAVAVAAGTDAFVWVLIGAGVLALAGLGRRVARGGKAKGVATT